MPYLNVPTTNSLCLSNQYLPDRWYLSMNRKTPGLAGLPLRAGFSYWRVAMATVFVLIIQSTGWTQSLPQTEEEFDSLYAVRITKEELNGVYIPIDLNDAFRELQRLSSDADLEKFRDAPEEIISTKLHFGLGRWIYVNWGFYLGSRFSHYLKKLGLEHPDDMTRFVIVSFHRHLNETPLDVEGQVSELQRARDKERQERAGRSETVLDTVRIREN